VGAAAHSWLNSVPLFPVVFGAGLVVTAVYVRRLSERSGLPDWIVFGLSASLWLVVAATLSPGFGSIWGSCLHDIVRPLGPSGLLAGGDRSLNTWLFVPLGFFAALSARRFPWLMVAVFATPFLVEGTQRFLPLLGRRCQFQDLVDNTWGLILGACAGLLLTGFTSLRSRR
jgi:VanZ like family